MSESILWVTSTKSERHNAVRTARIPDPLVSVDDALRSRLASEVDSIQTTAKSLPAEALAAGIPLVTRLRPEARPKSKRPYDFLEAQGLPVAAAGAPGELVSRARSEELDRLAHSIRERNVQKDVFAISTVDEFRLWNPIKDAIPAQELAINTPADSGEAGKAFELVFFPWIDPQETKVKGRQTSVDLLRSNGAEHVRVTAGNSGRTLAYVTVPQSVKLTDLLEDQFGVRAASVAPAASVFDDDAVGLQSIRPVGFPVLPSIPAPGDDCDAIVGVVDSGISENILADWIKDSMNFVPAGREDFIHGTFVGGLISAGSLLNGGLRDFPVDQARLIDVQVFGRGTTPIPVIEEALIEALDKWAKHVKVWNCSFAEVTPSTQLSYSPFAQIMDELSQEYGVLFVQAAGNSQPGRRRWPVNIGHGVNDVVSPPAEAINSLTVGALSFLEGGFTPKGAPASYSRRGPAFSGLMKPEVTHFAGDLSAGDASKGVAPSLDGWGVLSALPGGMLGESVGTSFSTPFVSVIAANLWARLSQSIDEVDAALVKGVIAHAAAVSSGPVSREEAPYRGLGVPPESLAILSEGDDSFTTIHAADLVDGIDWIKLPFPVPNSMMVNGKFRGEVFVTVSFAPLIRPEFDSECVRSSVQASFGPCSEDEGVIKVSSMLESTNFRANEEELVDDGKWAPLRTYYAKFPKGRAISGESLALRLRLLMRDKEDLGHVQRVYVAVTLRGDSDVHAEGVEALRALNYQFTPLQLATQITI